MMHNVKNTWCYAGGIDYMEFISFYQDVFGSLVNRNGENRNNKLQKTELI